MPHGSKCIARVVVSDAWIARVQQSLTIKNGAPSCETVERGEGEAIVDGRRRRGSIVEHNSFAGCRSVDVVILACLDAIG